MATLPHVTSLLRCLSWNPQLTRVIHITRRATIARVTTVIELGEVHASLRCISMFNTLGFLLLSSPSTLSFCARPTTAYYTPVQRSHIPSIVASATASTQLKKTVTARAGHYLYDSPVISSALLTVLRISFRSPIRWPPSMLA